MTAALFSRPLSLFTPVPSSQLGVGDLVKRLSGSPDPVTQKYLARIQSKLQQSSAAAAVQI